MQRKKKFRVLPRDNGKFPQPLRKAKVKQKAFASIALESQSGNNLFPCMQSTKRSTQRAPFCFPPAAAVIYRVKGPRRVIRGPWNATTATGGGRRESVFFVCPFILFVLACGDIPRFSQHAMTVYGAENGFLNQLRDSTKKQLQSSPSTWVLYRVHISRSYVSSMNCLPSMSYLTNAGFESEMLTFILCRTDDDTTEIIFPMSHERWNLREKPFNHICSCPLQENQQN